MQEQNKERKTGIIRSWHEQRGFGVIRCGPPTSLEKYFLHVSGIRTGVATPSVGMVLTFEVADTPVEEGKLPRAIRADIEIESIKSQESDGVGGAA